MRRWGERQMGREADGEMGRWWGDGEIGREGERKMGRCLIDKLHNVTYIL